MTIKVRLSYALVHGAQVQVIVLRQHGIYLHFYNCCPITLKDIVTSISNLVCRRTSKEPIDISSTAEKETALTGRRDRRRYLSNGVTIASHSHFFVIWPGKWKK